MTQICLESLRGSFEGVVASILATCDGDNVPNISTISQVHYVDSDRVALSYQFFNKTRRNLLLTRAASVMVFDAKTLAVHRLDLEYEETQTTGPLFESMKAKLAGIASHHGMDGVFRLLGSDIFRVRGIAQVPYALLPVVEAERPLLPALRKSCAELSTQEELDELLDCALGCLEKHFDITHSMVLMVESDARRLYTVASRGYVESGIGSEVAFGEGVIGVAARENTPIRIGHMTTEYRYGATLIESARRAGIISINPVEIPFPGLAAPRSQLALPIAFGGVVLGVLFAESEETMRFCYDDEDALAVLANHLASLIALVRDEAEGGEEEVGEPADVAGETVIIRFYRADQSVFLDHDYLIKGVAGAILWRLVKEYAQTGRTEFSTRELRLDPFLRLPAHSENLDARLILLRKRLDERDSCLRIEKSGRGRFRIIPRCRIELQEMADNDQVLAG